MGKQVVSKDVIYGKVPPQAMNLERAVLGILMMDKNALSEVADLLSEEVFYKEAHRIVYKAIMRLDSKNRPVDLLTVREELFASNELEGVGGDYELSKLTDTDPRAYSSIHEYAQIIVQKAMLRAQITAGNEMVIAAYEPSADPFVLLDNAETKLMAISNGSSRNKIMSIDSAVMKMLHRVEELRNKNEDITGVPSGYRDLDRVTFGWQQTDLIILAARPAVGKTAFALNLVRNAAMGYAQIPVGFFSLEMSASQVTERLTSAVSGIALENIRRGKIEGLEKQLYAHAAALSEAPIYLDDTPALNVFELRAKARRMKNKFGIGMIVIDYLQLMSGTGQKGQNREQEISYISRNLKALAKELCIPIIALSQLSRAVETRGGDKPKMPQLSDLRESGAIEQDADMVMFIYRPEYYEIKTNEMGESSRGETHIKIAKHRNGSLEEIKLMAQLQYQRFVDWDDSFAAPVTSRTWVPQSNIRMPYNDSRDDSPF